MKNKIKSVRTSESLNDDALNPQEAVEPKNESFRTKGLNKLLVSYTLKTHKHAIANVENEDAIIPLNFAVLYMPDDKNIIKLLHETGEIIRNQHQSLGYVIYLVDEAKKNLFICPDNEELFFTNRFTFNIELDRTVAIHVYRTNEPLNISTLKSDMRFPDFQEIPEIYATNIVTVPMINFQNEIVGVFEVFRDNCIDYDENEFEKFIFLSEWMAEGMFQNKEQVVYKRFNEISEMLMTGINDNFLKEYHRHNDEFLHKLVVLAKLTFDAESATVFLKKSDNELYKEITTESLADLKPYKVKLRLGKELQLAKITTDSNVTINYTDVYNDPRFDKEIDLKTGKIIRTVLASPIRFDATSSFGTIQLLNKLNDDYFTSIDEQFIKTFSESSSIWLHYRTACEQSFNQRILNDIVKGLIYRQWSTPSNLNECFSIDETIYMPNNFLSFEFHPYPEYATLTSKFVYYIMLTTCKEMLSSNREPLYQFVNIVKQCYLEAEITNFSNAFSALHFIFIFLKRYDNENSEPLFTEKETLALLISVLGCQIDCDGKLIEYIECKRKNLVDLYEDFAVERHQIWLTKILVQGSRLLDHLPQKDQDEIIKMIEENILNVSSTKNAQLLLKAEFLIEKDEFDLKLAEHRLIIRAMLLTCGIEAFCVKKLPYATEAYQKLIDQINREKTCKTGAKYDPQETIDLAYLVVDRDFESILETFLKLFPFVKIIMNLYRNFNTNVMEPRRSGNLVKP